MITTVAEHSVDLDILPPEANILDLGCRGFAFTKFFRDLGHKVWPVDIDRLDEGQAYYQMAISNFEGRTGILHTGDKQATRMQSGDEVPCHTLATFTKLAEIKKRWDLIKIDVEGAEYEIIMSLTKAPAKQISIEFHLHTGIYTQKEMLEMEVKLATLGYVAHIHQLTEAHGAGYNYWDSLFINIK